MQSAECIASLISDAFELGCFYFDDDIFKEIVIDLQLLDQNNSEQVVNKKVDPVYGSDELLKEQIDSQKGDYGTTE